MRKATSTSSNNNESDAVISKLQEENAKLSSFLDKLTEELKTKKQQQQQQQEPKPVPLKVSSTNKPENATLKVDKSILDSVCS
jgi:phenylalanyl-tRNA synthetase alpha subunit